jgi:hypothetical protein
MAPRFSFLGPGENEKTLESSEPETPEQIKSQQRLGLVIDDVLGLRAARGLAFCRFGVAIDTQPKLGCVELRWQGTPSSSIIPPLKLAP